MDVVFFGNYHEVLKALLDSFSVKIVVMECGKTTPEMLAMCSEHSIGVRLVCNVMDIELLETEPCLCFIASFGLLFSQKVIDKFVKIVNIHPGDLFTCRGRHPLPFAVLKKLTFMTITAHTVDSPAIDAGNVILSMSAPIDYSDSYIANEKRLRLLLYNFASSVVKMFQSDLYFECALFSCKLPPYNKRLTADVLEAVVNCDRLESLKCEL